MASWRCVAPGSIGRRRRGIARLHSAELPLNLHRPTGTPLVGIALGAVTALLWGTLPVMLKILVGWLDVYTITWFRFTMAGVCLLPFAVASGGLGQIASLRGLPRWLLILSTVGLTGNYLSFMGGLNFVSPATAQIVIQLSPVFMLLGGLLIFRESFSRYQWLGLLVLLMGQILFFGPRFERFTTDFDTEGVGVLLIVLAAVLWGLYMVSQKQLLQNLRAEVILVVIYVVGSTALIPTASPSTLLSLPRLGVALLVGSSLGTLVSYFTFARALHHVEASRIGVLISMTPIIVVTLVEILSVWQPGLIDREELPFLSIVGALLVVCGSALSALGAKRITTGGHSTSSGLHCRDRTSLRPDRPD